MEEKTTDFQKVRSYKLLVGEGEPSILEKKMIAVYDILATLGITLTDMSNEVMKRRDKHLTRKIKPLVERYIKLNDGLSNLIEDQFNYIEFLPPEAIEVVEEV